MNDHTADVVGVDISKAHLDAHRHSTGESARFANAATGFDELAAWVGDAATLVVYESTGPWHRAFEERLAGRLSLARVNALRARRFAQVMGVEAKTDAADAAHARRDGCRGRGRRRGTVAPDRGVNVDPQRRPGGRALDARIRPVAGTQVHPWWSRPASGVSSTWRPSPRLRCNPDMAHKYAELRACGKPALPRSLVHRPQVLGPFGFIVDLTRRWPDADRWPRPRRSFRPLRAHAPSNLGPTRLLVGEHAHGAKVLGGHHGPW